MTFGKILPYLLKGERVWLRGMPPFNTSSEVCELVETLEKIDPKTSLDKEKRQ